MRAVLALDTAGETAGAALAVDGVLKAEVVEASASRHSQRLFRLVDGVLEGAGLKPRSLGCVAVSRGPGSFTGLRVGVATAKGIAFALGLPAVGVSTLEALARGAMPFPGVIVPLLDARKQQVYAAAWDGRTGARLLPEAARNPERFAAELAGLAEAGSCLLLGSGLSPYADRFREALGDRFLPAPPARWPIPPGQVALLGDRDFLAGNAVEPARLVPVYHRLSEAEERKGARAVRL
ncbi:MAG: tRNA (adenosine(37)-N6)-threonylcarbamoyltransferase complex dimerization subunit type 1 TsaB [Deltaproteobacteria bacterium]|nr:tRNA (adenosine(37)-N6)-threonylcarbamoyltransferase complex dimerization subunit type 1 TsaB [Deltaproteobacteria bacterium]